MEKITQKILSGERALFMGENLEITDTVFADGESPLKESKNIRLDSCIFRWKYPLWYSSDICMKNCALLDTARAGIWYTNNISVENTTIEAPKTFRRSDIIALRDVTFPNADETLWNCSNVVMKNISAKGDYFAMNGEGMNIDNLSLTGNYSFDGAQNVLIKNSKMLSKDAFWNSDNIIVYDSFISGEYLGWNAKNLTLVNCTVESLQGMCYIDNLVMRNCKLINTTLAFEYSTVNADICSGIDSVINPSGGTIRADYIGELIIEPDKVDKSKTKIIVRK